MSILYYRLKTACHLKRAFIGQALDGYDKITSHPAGAITEMAASSIPVVGSALAVPRIAQDVRKGRGWSAMGNIAGAAAGLLPVPGAGPVVRGLVNTVKHVGNIAAPIAGQVMQERHDQQQLQKAAEDDSSSEPERTTGPSLRARLLSGNLANAGTVIGRDMAYSVPLQTFGKSLLTSEDPESVSKSLPGLLDSIGLKQNVKHFKTKKVPGAMFSRFKGPGHILLGPKNMSDNVVAHELGHARVAELLDNVVNRKVQTGVHGAANLTNLLGNAAGSYGWKPGMQAATAANLYTLGNELAASHLGGKALASLRGGSFGGKTKNYLSAYAGVPAYALHAAKPYATYRLGKWMRGEKDEPVKQASPMNVLKVMGGLPGKLSEGISKLYHSKVPLKTQQAINNPWNQMAAATMAPVALGGAAALTDKIMPPQQEIQ